MESKNTKILTILIVTLSVIWSLFHMYTAAFGVLPALQQRSIHLMFALIILFLTYSFNNNENKKHIFTIEKSTFAIISLLALGYVAVNHEVIWSQTSGLTVVQEIISFIIIILVLESSRRTIGWALPVIALFFIGYAFFGPYLPNIIEHSGFGLAEMFRHSVMGLEGIFGLALGVVATFVFLFVLYAAILQQSGGGQFFIDVASWLVGGIRGGAAKISVIASGLFGSVSGNAVANAAGTGPFTIPLMKHSGYKARFAAAVEAVSSTGGQFVPPLMGAAAFLIAEVLGIPFWEVALGALLPAILFYAAIFFTVDAEAAKKHIKGIDRSELPDIKETLKKGWHLLLSPLVLVYLLIVLQWSPMYAAFWAIIVAILSTFLNKNNRLTIPQLLKSMRKGAVNTVSVTAACACVGIVIGVVGQTGLGFSISSILITLAGENIYALLFFTMVASLILGMGLPTVAVYLVLGVMVAPALIDVGFDPLAAHLFIFYFGILSNITPPVALAAFVTSGLAETKPFPTSITAMRLGITAFILPFVFILSPELVMQGSFINTSWAFITAFIGIYAFSTGIQRFNFRNLRLWESAALIIVGIMILLPNVLTSIIGLSLLPILIIYYNKSKEPFKNIQLS